MDPNAIIDKLGGTNAVAKLCEIEPASVSEWRRNGIPKARLMYLRLAKPAEFKELERAATRPHVAKRQPERRRPA